VRNLFISNTTPPPSHTPPTQIDLITNHSEVGVGFSSTALSATRKKAAEKPLDDAVVEVVDQPTEANCTSNGIEADSWACTMCTFVNPSTRSKCEMCDTFRDEGVLFILCI